MADAIGRAGPWRGLALLVAAAAFGILIGWPLTRLAIEAAAAGTAPLVAALRPDSLAAIGNSLWIAAVVTVLAVAGGLWLAFLTEHAVVPRRTILLIGILLPLLVPDFVSALAWTRAFGPAGLLDRIAGIEIPGLYGPVGIVLVLATGAIPLAYLLIAAGMRSRAEPDLERAARISGADGLTALRTVSLPLLWPIIAAAGALIFATTMSAFGTPAVLGRPAGFVTMTTRIYGDLAFSSNAAAFERVLGLSFLLVAVVVVALVFGGRIGPRTGTRGTITGPAAQAQPARWLPLALAWAFVGLTVVLPLVALVLTALTRAVGLPPLPEHLTLANFSRAVDSRTLPALLNSLVLAALAAMVCVTLGAAAAIAPIGRWRRRWSQVVTIGFAIPGSVFAVGVLLAFGRSLRDTLLIILLAYVAKLWALALQPIAGAMDRVPADLTHAARIHGADGRTSLRTVVLPILAPTFAAAGLLVFVFALHEVTISILLYGPSSATLAVAILNLQQLGDPTVTTALAVMLTLLVLVSAAPLIALRRSWLHNVPG
ncbi:MAG: ABC transporter permease subunit [Chloroflexota bacterium]|nr:ABC transporter permease subunit [Chloroflexota bacterium]